VLIPGSDLRYRPIEAYPLAWTTGSSRSSLQRDTVGTRAGDYDSRTGLENQCQSYSDEEPRGFISRAHGRKGNTAGGYRKANS